MTEETMKFKEGYEFDAGVEPTPEEIAEAEAELKEEK